MKVVFSQGSQRPKAGEKQENRRQFSQSRVRSELWLCIWVKGTHRGDLADEACVAYTTSGKRFGKDRATKGGVTLTARPAEKGKSFYEKTGLASNKVHNGKEIYLGAWASAKLGLRVAGKSL